jgi:large subunit ribosomal protein L18e
MRKTNSPNQYLQLLIGELLKAASVEQVPLWRRIASELSKPSRMRRVVNLSKINRYTKDAETIIVPGKVLGTGAMEHKVTVAAMDFSHSARQRIMKANGRVLSIVELMKDNPKAKNVRIMG